MRADMMTACGTITERLVALQNSDGGWSAAPDGESRLEPTAWAVLALSAGECRDAGGAADARRRALDTLTALQKAPGAFGLSRECRQENWATPLAGLAMTAAGRAAPAVRAVRWLLEAPALATDHGVQGICGFDTRPRGWPWTPGDYSFIEPTAWAVLFLKREGLGGHPRVREAVAMLEARALPRGGWNYGEPTVLGRTLWPAVLPTAAALLALQDEPGPVVRDACAVLLRMLAATPSIRSELWARLALRLHDHAPPAPPEAMVDRIMAATASSAELSAIALLALADRVGHPLALRSPR